MPHAKLLTPLRAATRRRRVKSAIEHFVGTGGAHFDDPDYTKNQKAIKDWVAALCPS